MGFRAVVLFGFVLLILVGNPCAAQNITTNETPQEKVTTSSLLPRSAQTADHQSNWTARGHPVTHRLKIHQLRKHLAEHMNTHQNPQRPEVSRLTSEQLEPAQPPESLKLAFQGPDLNPPVKPESKVLVMERRVPVPADSVAARCGEREVTVEVKQNFLGNGQLIRPGDLTLGGCVAADTAHVLRFHTELHGCGSMVTLTEDAVIYSFTLTYTPTPVGNTFILKTNPAEVVIECHYRRRNYVSSAGAMRPTWTPFASSTLAKQQLHFSLRLVTEDLQSPRPSSVYFLSDVMHMEAAVLQGHHAPLRVYVDSCVATASPDPNSQPRYPFISNHGCFSDGKLTGAKSYFMQRSQEDKLHFKLKAFRFHHDHRNSLYITCHLKATPVSVPIDPQHKVCSFLTEVNRWVASGGDNEVCGCCETSCSERRLRRSLGADAVLPRDQQWEGVAALGPILLEENILLEELMELTELMELQAQEVTQAASHSSLALLCGAGTALAVVLLLFMGAIICSRRHKPTGYFVCT